MKRIVSLILIFVLMITCFSGCAEEKQPLDVQARLEQIQALGKSPEDNYRVWYEIFVYSYCDSDGDGIGDLQGIIRKLPELQAMGIGGIWLMPVHPSSSYHKYNVEDYYAIDPKYGTMEDFEALIAACDQLGIKVIMDLVVNHSGSAHPWFQSLCQYLRSLDKDEEADPAECKYVDYYNLRKDPATGYAQVSTSSYYYECQFSHEMPDLNLGSEAVRAEIRDIMEFWLGKGVSGFRLDAAKEFYSGQTQKNVEVLSFLQQTAASIKEDAYMVAEVWEGFSTVADYYQSGITSLFNFPFGNSNGKIVDVLRSAGNPSKVTTYATALEKADQAYLANHGSYIDAPFLSNHDVGRIASFVSQDEAKTKLAGAMNLFMGGSAFVYYGEEIGMVSGGANDPSKRAPMYWNAERNDGTTNCPPECTLPEAYPFGSLAQQKESPYSVYNYYRQAIAIRNALPVISHGRVTAEAALNKGCISAQRKTWEQEQCIILMNISDDAAQVDLSAYADWSVTATLSVGEEEPERNGSVLNLPGYGVAILRPGK